MTRGLNFKKKIFCTQLNFEKEIEYMVESQCVVILLIIHTNPMGHFPWPTILVTAATFRNVLVREQAEFKHER